MTPRETADAVEALLAAGWELREGEGVVVDPLRGDRRYRVASPAQLARALAVAAKDAEACRG